MGVYLTLLHNIKNIKMTTNEINQICEYIKERMLQYEPLMYEIWKVQINTGLRVSEVININSNIIGENGDKYLIKTCKGSGIRQIDKVELDKVILILNNMPHKITYKRYRRVMIAILSENNVYTENKKCITHLARHLYAKKLSQQGQSAAVIADDMKVEIATAERYINSNLRRKN